VFKNKKSIELLPTNSISWISAQVLFWLIFISIWLYFSPKEWSYSKDVSWTLINTCFYIVLVNVNLRFLLPRLMQSQSMIIYTSSLLGLGIVLTPIKIWFNTHFCYGDLLCPNWITDAKFHYISMIVLAAISSLVRIPLDWLTVQKEKKELITKNVQTELQFLKNQINPHFLFNTLNNLYALTLKKSDDAPDVVLKLSDMMRYMLYECNEKEVPLEKEIQYIKNYIELEKIRLSKNAEINISIEGEYQSTRVAPLLFIPFIENSFKHGIKTSLNNAFINIQFMITDQEIQFIVKNSKSDHLPGHGHARKVGGIGLVNVKKRLELIYPKTHQLEINSLPDAYEIQLNITTNK